MFALASGLLHPICILNVKVCSLSKISIMMKLSYFLNVNKDERSFSKRKIKIYDDIWCEIQGLEHMFSFDITLPLSY